MKRAIAAVALAAIILGRCGGTPPMHPEPSAATFVPTVRLEPAEVRDTRPAPTAEPTGDIGTAIIGWPDGRTETVGGSR